MTIETIETVNTPVTLGMALRPAWGNFWRMFLITLATRLVNYTVVVGGIAAGLYAVAPVALSGEYFLIAFAGILQSAVFGTVLVHILYQRRYKHFSIVPRSTETHEVITLCYGKSFKIWWSLFWRQFLIIAGVGVIVGVVIAGLSAAAQPFLMAAPFVMYAVLIVAAIVVTLYVTRIVMQKRYRDFYLTVVPHDAAATIA